MLILISYDIEDDGGRARVHRILEGHGERVQYSVFECWLEPVDLAKLKERLAPHVKGEFDSVRFYKICGECAKGAEVIGWGDPPREPEVWVV